MTTTDLSTSLVFKERQQEVIDRIIDRISGALALRTFVAEHGDRFYVDLGRGNRLLVPCLSPEQFDATVAYISSLFPIAETGIDGNERHATFRLGDAEVYVYGETVPF